MKLTPQQQRQVDIEGMFQDKMADDDTPAIRLMQQIVLGALNPDKRHYPKLHARDLNRFLQGMSDDLTDADSILIGRRLEHLLKMAVAQEEKTKIAVTPENVVKTLTTLHHTLDKACNQR